MKHVVFRGLQALDVVVVYKTRIIMGSVTLSVYMNECHELLSLSLFAQTLAKYLKLM